MIPAAQQLEALCRDTVGACLVDEERAMLPTGTPRNILWHPDVTANGDPRWMFDFYTRRWEPTKFDPIRYPPWGKGSKWLQIVTHAVVLLR